MCDTVARVERDRVPLARARPPDPVVCDVHLVDDDPGSPFGSGEVPSAAVPIWLLCTVLAGARVDADAERRVAGDQVALLGSADRVGVADVDEDALVVRHGGRAGRVGADVVAADDVPDPFSAMPTELPEMTLRLAAPLVPIWAAPIA